jgi:hypothetical protein
VAVDLDQRRRDVNGCLVPEKPHHSRKHRICPSILSVGSTISVYGLRYVGGGTRRYVTTPPCPKPPKLRTSGQYINPPPQRTLMSSPTHVFQL